MPARTSRRTAAADPPPVAEPPVAAPDPAVPAEPPAVPEPETVPPPPEVAPDRVLFDPRPYLTNLGGKAYIEVKWRLVWLRNDHPDARIFTELHSDTTIEMGGKTVRRAIFRAEVRIPNGGSATGWGSETENDFRDYVEKAETKALGRALGALGYGTQFGTEFGDAPDGAQEPTPPPRPAQAARSGAIQVPDVASVRSLLKMGDDVETQEQDWDARIREAGDDFDKWRLLVVMARRAVEADSVEDQAWRFAHLAMAAPGKKTDQTVVLRGIKEIAAKCGALTEYVRGALEERERALNDPD